MNKNIRKLLVMGLAGITLCGTAMAAPSGGHGGAQHGAPVHHQAPKHHEAHHGGHHHDHGGGWLTLGAAAIGAVVGSIIGACR